MIRFAKTKSGHRILRSPVSTVLVSYLVFATLLPALHLGFAKHSHKYDLVTKQYFDVVQIVPKEPGTAGSKQLGTESGITRPEIKGLKIYRCAVSNGLVLSSIQIDLIGSAIDTHSSNSDSEFNIENEFRPQKTISIAPKQSPPTYV